MREAEYRDYTATMQRHLVNLIGHYMYGSKWQQMPSFLKIAHPEMKDESQPQQTAEEAKAHIYEIFGITPEALKGRG